MHPTIKRVKSERFADLIQNIIKKQSETEILQSVSGEMKNIKMKKFKNVELIEKINELVSEMDFMHFTGKGHQILAIKFLGILSEYLNKIN